VVPDLNQAHRLAIGTAPDPDEQIMDPVAVLQGVSS